MKTIITTAFLLAMATGIYSCKKDSESTDIKPQGTISIYTPAGGSTYKQGDTVRIHAMLAADVQLHGYELYILSPDGDTLFNATEHAHQKEIEVQERWANTLANTTELTLLIATSIDHDGNKLEKAQTFNIN